MVAFVGRQPELAVLRARLADALAGRPQIVQIQGPAGIGKTALLDQFLTEIAGIGDVPRAPVVIRASGEETEELLAYGVVEQLARSIVHPAAPEPLVRSGHDRRQIAGVPRPVRRLTGRAGPGRRALGRSSVPAGADLCAPAVVRRPGPDHHRGARGRRRGSAGQPSPVGHRAAGHRPAVAWTGRTGPARSRRGDGCRAASARARPAGCVTEPRETRCTRGRCWRSSRWPPNGDRHRGARHSGARMNCCRPRCPSAGWCRSATRRRRRPPAG